MRLEDLPTKEFLNILESVSLSYNNRCIKVKEMAEAGLLTPETYSRQVVFLEGVQHCLLSIKEGLLIRITND